MEWTSWPDFSPVTRLGTNNSKKWLTTYKVWVIDDLIIPSCIILFTAIYFIQLSKIEVLQSFTIY